MTIEVSDIMYYHINTNANMSPHPLMRCGDVIEVGNATNPFFKFYENQKRTYPVTLKQTGETVQVPAMRFLSQVKAGTITSDSLPAIAYDTANHFLMLSRELLWENIRLAEFPTAPSRQKCIWLIESLTDARKWVKTLGFHPLVCFIVKVRATGRAITVDSNLLAGDSEPLPMWCQKAQSYWSAVMSENPFREILFEGRIVVDEILNTAEVMSTGDAEG